MSILKQSIMKKQSIMLLLLVSFTFGVFVSSCSSDENSNEYNVGDKNFLTTENVELNFVSVLNNKIGHREGNNIVLDVSFERVIATFKKESDLEGLNLEVLYFNVEKIDGKDYLRFHCDNNIVSTIELFSDEYGKVTTGSTKCTSSSCATGGGCIPDGSYCTKCMPEGVGPKHPGGDCLRTTTG